MGGGGTTISENRVDEELLFKLQTHVRAGGVPGDGLGFPLNLSPYKNSPGHGLSFPGYIHSNFDLVLKKGGRRNEGGGMKGHISR